MALKRHDAKHLDTPQTYSCHMCDKSYSRGHLLSKHLKKDHGFSLPAGHSRFIYKQDFDGLYRLQTKRVENLKESAKAFPVDSDSGLVVSYKVNEIIESTDVSVPLTLKVTKEVRQKRQKAPVIAPLSILLDESTEDSTKDINDFAVVKKYEKALR